MEITNDIKAALKDALEDLKIEAPTIELEHPAELAHGDYASNIALAALAKMSNPPPGGPRALAEQIVAALESPSVVERVEVAGPGFINFFLKRSFFAETTLHIHALRDKWGRSHLLQDKKIMVEYTQPNPFKPFHIGHLMSNTIGESISRLIEFAGADIKRANYQGDIGPHVAKAIWALEKGNFDVNDIGDIGRAYVMGAAAYEEDQNAKAEIDALNRRLYADDPQLASVYETGRRVSLEHFEELYGVLGTKFDCYFFEKQTAPVGIEIVKKGLADGIFEESDGAIVFRGEKYDLHTRVFITSQGTPTYEAKELGLAQMKREAFRFDVNITTTAVEQEEYFKVVTKVMDLLWPEHAGTYQHVPHGMMQLMSGKMSSRKGNVITGESLLHDMRTRALEKMEARDLGDRRQEIADAVAVAAIKYSVLKQGTGKNVSFDPEASLTFEGDSGPYLQYSYVRAMSVMKKAREEGIDIKAGHAPEETTELERILYRFPEVVGRATFEREPHHVTTYLTHLAGVFNTWYGKEKIVDAGDEFSPYKVALTAAFAQTMHNGLWLLGIRTPEEM